MNILGNNENDRRKQLWYDVYLAATNRGDYQCSTLADDAVRAYDALFNPKVETCRCAFTQNGLYCAADVPVGGESWYCPAHQESNQRNQTLGLYPRPAAK